MESLLSLGHKAGDALRGAVAAVTPVPTESKFVEEGTLTPDEFLNAGDQLTYKFPSWSWDGGNEKYRAGYLPDNRQFLITRNVRCKERVRDLDSAIQQISNDDGWSLPPVTEDHEKKHGSQNRTAGADRDDAAPELPEGKPQAAQPVAVEAASSSASKSQNGGDGAVPDMDDFSALDNQLGGGLDDDPLSNPKGGISSGADDGDGFLLPDEAVGNTKMRTYDLSITYDKYYQTPRLWLFGYDCFGRPLEAKEIFEDVLAEYTAKTVTIDPHPLSGIPTCSIHPCKHAQVMKKVVAEWIEHGQNPRADLALFVFLKFISSVVPTIDYDCTMDIEM